MPNTCPRCDTNNADSLKYCDFCGFELCPNGPSALDNSAKTSVEMGSQLDITSEIELWMTLAQFLDRCIFEFSFDENNIDQMIHEMECIRELNISNSGLKDFPDCLTLLKNLETLNAASNNLSRFPAVLRTLPNLQKLDLSRNKLTSIPVWLPELHKISKLDISVNELTELPDNIHTLSNLEQLNVGANQLSCLPANITLLSKLLELDAYKNELKMLPESFETMTQMVWLDLDTNNITTLPIEMNDWSQLEHFSIANNPVFQEGLPKNLKRKADSSRKEFILYIFFFGLILLFAIFLLTMFL